MSEQAQPILTVRGISKRFGGVQALKDIHFDVLPGEVHALVGENGAGKSTLMNILGGIVPRDSGEVVFMGREVRFNAPQEAIDAGIAIIHQELAMLPTLSIIDNVFMGRMPARLGWISWGELEKLTQKALARVGLHQVNPYTRVRDLSASQRQLVEIAKALSLNARLLIMDEPNSSLSESETQTLFRVIHELQQDGVSIIFVSHKIEEVLQISQRISVLRDGCNTGTLSQSEATVEKIIQMMVGRELVRDHRRGQQNSGEVLLQVSALSGQGFRDVSFEVRKGEILGFSGLVGAGRSELARAVFGADPVFGGEIRWQGRPVRWNSPADAIRAGVAMVQEDRKVQSLFMKLPILFNMTLATLPAYTRRGWIDYQKAREVSQFLVQKLSIKLGSLDHPVSSLSGGNQQKTILARWLAANPKLLILDEPTHGVDVGAKAEIYQLIRRLAEDGVAIWLISSELPEILTMSDRVAVMCEGRLAAVLERDQADEEKIMAYATGTVSQPAAALL